MSHENEVPIVNHDGSFDQVALDTYILKSDRSVTVGASVGRKTSLWTIFLIVAVTLLCPTIVIPTTAISTRSLRTTTAMLAEHCVSSFRVMSYNIRLDLVQDGQNQWNLRKDRLTSLIRYHKPDLFGVQEALPHQVVDLKMALPVFDWYGVGRDDVHERQA
ncbi:unnamed protein product [Rotaria sordida]|uniref:Endonuclease/exonuclease/phosphatase domain-containing protein n=1 Tax=Rotaria sordida TaxID=392033 RepID=A0A814K4I3_9BILA|nr:unnamed protein product [Rotaria sordida]CAF1047599.1 unnamed protein product [Rotaria sordida]